MFHSLCGLNNVPGAVVIHMVLAVNVLTVTMIIVTLRLQLLGGRGYISEGEWERVTWKEGKKRDLHSSRFH